MTPVFRFTIRDMLWLTVVVALGAGFTVERWRLKRECREDHLIAVSAMEILNEIGYEVTINRSSVNPEIVVRDGEGEVRHRTR
jgi:hypothetical protein